MYCYFCMKEMEADVKICPHCGKGQNIITPPHRLLPGTMLNGRYVVGIAKGEGGFGITYIGRDKKLDRLVAIKEYYPTGYVNRNNTISPAVAEVTSEDSSAFFRKGCDRFLKEAKTIAKFSGEPGIVNVIDYFEENNTAYIVMEYLDGITLKDYLTQKGKLSVEETLSILRPVMLSLEKIHQQGLIHRDISPSNIMLVEDAVKLIDFGAARNTSGSGNKSLSLMRKPGYAPEEQYRSKGLQGAWTDVYALCATIYKCITGITPDEANDRLFADELKAPSALGINVTPTFETALMKGLAVHQKDRYQSIKELLEGFNGGTADIKASSDQEITMLSSPQITQEETATQYLPAEQEQETETQHIPEPTEDEKETQYYAEKKICLPIQSDNSPKSLHLKDTDKDVSKTTNTTNQNLSQPVIKEQNQYRKKSHLKSFAFITAAVSVILITGAIVVIIIKNNHNNTVNYHETFSVSASSSDETSLAEESKPDDFVFKQAHFFALPYNGIATITKDDTVSIVYVDAVDWEKVDKAKEWKNIRSLAAGYKNLYGLRKDGTVVATGNNYFGQCNVSEWKDVELVDACYEHTVALKSDGTAYATGQNTDHRCDVQDWDHLVYISSGRTHTVGLKDDGTVLVTGGNEWHQSEITDWTDMKMVSAGYYHTVGLKSDETVITQGSNKHGQCNTEEWKDIVAVYAGKMHTVGLKKDGTVLATGNNDYGQCNVDSWENIVEIYVEKNYTVGKTASGELLITGLCFYDEDMGTPKYYLSSYRDLLEQ